MVAAGLAGGGGGAAEGGQRRVGGEAAACVAELDQQFRGADLSAAWQRREDVAVVVQRKLLADLDFKGGDLLAQRGGLFDEQTQAAVGEALARTGELAAEGRPTAAARAFAGFPFSEEDIAVAEDAGYFESLSSLLCKHGLRQRQTFPATREQRCWGAHGNCLSALPKQLHPDAKAALAAIYGAETRAAGGRCHAGVRRSVRRTSEGGRQDHRRPRRAAGLLRLPRRALEAPAHHQRDRVDLRNRAPASARHQGAGAAAPAGTAMGLCKPLSNAGAASTVTNESRSCAPATAPRSSTANYKDDPTNRKGIE